MLDNMKMGKSKVITVAKLMIAPPPTAQWMQKRLKPGLRHESVHISFKIGVGHTSPTGARPFHLHWINQKKNGIVVDL